MINQTHKNPSHFVYDHLGLYQPILITRGFAMRKTFWAVSLTLLLLTLNCIATFQADASAKLPIIKTDELKSIIDQNENFSLINVLPKVIHDAKHIRGSINIPLGKMTTSDRLPEDKDTLLIFYCMGVL